MEVVEVVDVVAVVDVVDVVDSESSSSSSSAVVAVVEVVEVVEVVVVGEEDPVHTPADAVEDEAAEQELREAVVLRRVGIQDRGEAAGQEQVQEGQGHEVEGALDDLRARAGGVGAA